MSIWGLATGNRSLGEVHISQVRGTIIRDADGVTNLQRALESAGSGAAPPPVPAGPGKATRRLACPWTCHWR